MASVQKIIANKIRVTTILIDNIEPDERSITRKTMSTTTATTSQLSGIRKTSHLVPRRSITVNARIRAGTFSGMRKKSGIAVRRAPARRTNKYRVLHLSALFLPARYPSLLLHHLLHLTLKRFHRFLRHSRAYTICSLYVRLSNRNAVSLSTRHCREHGGRYDDTVFFKLFREHKCKLVRPDKNRRDGCLAGKTISKPWRSASHEVAMFRCIF